MASAVPILVPKDTEDYLYPDSDGKPLGETGFHVTAILTLFDTLQTYYRNVANIYVAADMFLYYEEGNPRACKSPDVMVIKGVSNKIRRTFKTWVEGTVPNVVVEVTSSKTIAEDLGDKKVTYERLGIAEYFLFDPEASILRPALQGFRLRSKRYVPIRRATDGSLACEQLDLRFRGEGIILRALEAATGKLVLSSPERADDMARELERLKAELARAKRQRK
jgi:Uma2 family endonuclease